MFVDLVQHSRHVLEVVLTLLFNGWKVCRHDQLTDGQRLDEQ